MAITADSNGVVQGKFTIPANVTSGNKLVRFQGSGGSHGSAVFQGQGFLTTHTLQRVTTTVTTLYDPLAQTFSLLAQHQIGGIDLFVAAKGATPIQVQIRETQVGVPTQSILCEAQLMPAQITPNSWQRFTFPSPVTLRADVEYAIVVLCNDPDAAVGIAELGKWDAAAGTWVTSQPYQVGVLLSSSNASTWTPHQDRDLAFRLLAASYTQSMREIDLGTVTLNGATDLLVLAASDQPSAQAGAQIELTMPDSSKVSASDGQLIRLQTPTSGDVTVKAKLNATQKVSAKLYPGVQIVEGSISVTADYVSRAFNADAAGATVRVIFDAMLPSGSSVGVLLSGVDAGDTWQAMTQSGVAKPLGDGWFEYQYLAGPVTEAMVRVKLALTGNSAARPFVSNLRVSVT